MNGIPRTRATYKHRALTPEQFFQFTAALTLLAILILAG